MTVTNDLLDRINRLYYGKMSGGISSDELSDILTKIGDLVANLIKNGKITDKETISEIERHLPDSRFFKFNHGNLNAAKKAFYEGDAVALSERESRFTMPAHQKIMH